MRLISILIFLLFSVTTAFADDFSMTTNAFLDSGALPVLYTCDGKDVSPDLTWSNPPAKTKSFVIIASDPAAGDKIFYHWVLYNIPGSTNTLQEGVTKLPSGALLGKNSWGKPSYNGPCPPKGTVHSYIITLYALDTNLSLPAGADAETVLKSMHGHILKQIKLTMVYSRWLK